MDASIDRNRRRFLRGAAMTLAAAEFGILNRLRAEGASASLAEALAEAGSAKAREAQSRQIVALGRTREWLNSPPVSSAALRGKVVLVQFGTYTCITGYVRFRIFAPGTRSTGKDWS